jgi:hypothetical protein
MLNGNKPAPPGGGRTWLPLAMIGAVAVVSGILLPQMLGGAAPLPEAPKTAVAEAKKESLDYTPPVWPDAPDPRAMLTWWGRRNRRPGDRVAKPLAAWEVGPWIRSTSPNTSAGRTR